MIAKRVIPVVLVRGRELVKGKRFNAWRRVGVAMQAMRVHAIRSVDELVMLDISATMENRAPDFSLIKELSATCFIPLAVGGGVHTIDDAVELLRSGADKLVLGTAAFENSDFLFELVNHVGSQSVCVALDVGENWVCYTENGCKAWGDVLEEARYFQAMGVGEILLTSMYREGTMDGYDLSLIQAVSSEVDVPVVANGGCGGYEHMHQALCAGAHAVAAGALWQFSDATPRDAAHYLRRMGWETRLYENR